MNVDTVIFEATETRSDVDRVTFNCKFDVLVISDVNNSDVGGVVLDGVEVTSNDVSFWGSSSAVNLSSLILRRPHCYKSLDSKPCIAEFMRTEEGYALPRILETIDYFITCPGLLRNQELHA